MSYKTTLLRQSQRLETSNSFVLKDTLETLEEKHGTLLAGSLGWNPKTDPSSGQPIVESVYPTGLLTGCVLLYQSGEHYELKLDSETGQYELSQCPPWNSN